ncbi:MAG: hypothetical protein LBQ09_02120, partial [Acidobacteriaceae bacterium]|nr:hypothetical protein [Acidobacteriaceae bacterium]
MSLVVVTSERVAEHQTPPGHPESPQRAAVLNNVASEWRRRDGEVVRPSPASREALLRVHDAAYLDWLDGYAGRSAALDADTFTSPESIEIATLAAGAAVTAVDAVLDGQHAR